MRGRLFVLAVSLGLLLACGKTCGLPGDESPRPPTEGLRYRVRVPADLMHVEVEVCYAGLAGGRLIAGHRSAFDRVEHVRWLGPGAVERLPTTRDSVPLPDSPEGGCLSYRANLESGGSLSTLVDHFQHGVLASPNAWLLRPDRRQGGLQASLELELPEGMHALLPWPREGSHYVLSAQSFRFDSYAAFGSFDTLSIERAGMEIETAWLSDFPRLSEAARKRWLNGAACSVLSAQAGFAHTRILLFVVPGGHGGAPFGSVARGGVGSVLLLLPDDVAAGTLEHDWVLVHELSHLLLPFVGRNAAWLPEGLSSYYQEVLRARSGMIAPKTAVRNLVTSLRSAANEGTGRSLAQESEAMHQTRAYRAVYWGGAALIWKADAQLRADTRGAMSLDWALSRLSETTDPHRVWTAPELLTKLDEITGTHVFRSLLETAEVRSFPEMETIFTQLGVARPDEGFDDEAPLSEVRNGIFAPRVSACAPQVVK